MTAADPLFSVVMPAFNAGGTIEAAITSVQRQTVRDFELIVVDDGSSDETASQVRRLQSDDRIRLLQQPNAGPAAARNAGIRASRAPLVSVVDSDDMWLPTYLECMGRALAGESAAGLAYTDAWLLDDETCRLRRRTAMRSSRPPHSPPRDPRQMLLLLLDRNVIYTSATVRRTVLEQVGGYDERLSYSEDYELWLRIVEAGWSAVRVPDILAIHRQRRGSLTDDVHRFYAGKCRVYELIAEEHGLDPAARALVLERRERWSVHLARLDAPRRRDRLVAFMRRGRALLDRLLSRLERPPAEARLTLEQCGGATSVC